MLASTVFLSLLMLCVGVVLLLPVYNSLGGGAFPLLNAMPAVLLMLVILVSWLYSPYAYEITSSELIILRRFMPVRIALSSITGVRIIAPEEMKFSIRVCGVGGLFGCYGFYYNKTLGKYSLYARNTKGFVLVEAGSKKIVLTPDDIEGFVGGLKAVRI